MAEGSGVAVVIVSWAKTRAENKQSTSPVISRLLTARAQRNAAAAFPDLCEDAAACRAPVGTVLMLNRSIPPKTESGR